MTERTWITIRIDSIWMENAVPDTEKITINISVVDLGKIDLLVDEGMYSGRTDLVRTAIRNQLDRHHDELGKAVVRNAYVVGALAYGRATLERAKARGELLDVAVIGMLSIAADVPPELADGTIAAVRVRGLFRASPAVKAVLADRTV